MSQNGRNDISAYRVDGCEAVEFKLVRRPEDIRNAPFFRPTMCHQIFGESEEIVGYKNPRIKIYYSAGRLEIYNGVEYTWKHRDVEVVDIQRKISNAYKTPIITNLDEFERKLENEKTFKPFGSLVSAFQINDPDTNTDMNLEIYFYNNASKEFSNYYARLQTFLLWYIDAANFIECDDPSWNFFIVYEKYKIDSDTQAYGIVGLSTIYNFYAHPSKIRPRISQFLILPPFFRRGIGTKLLFAIYDYYAGIPNVLDFTVEDPVVEFQRLRDYVDCKRVESSGFYSKDMLKEDIPSGFVQKLQSELKLYKNQAIRVSEILRLQFLNEDNEEEMKKYRLTIKRRLNKPYQKQQQLKKKCAGAMSEQAMKENFVSDEVRKEEIEQQYQDILFQYNLVISRLQED